MIEVPATHHLPGGRIYREATAGGARGAPLALDPVQAAVRAEGVQWLVDGSGQAHFSAEVRFGAIDDLARAARRRYPDARVASLPWPSGPVYAWIPDDDAVRIVARGKTSGYGQHNAVLSGTVPAELAGSEVVIATELTCPGKLTGAHLQGGGEAAVIEELLPRLPVGADAPPTATLADVLLPILAALVKDRQLALVARADGQTVEALAELRELALLEWARRIADRYGSYQGRDGGAVSLAHPAALIAVEEQGRRVDLQLDWAPGSTVALRAARSLVLPGSVRKLGTPPGAAAEVSATVIGDWHDFSVVDVTAERGDGAAAITLTPARRRASSPTPADADSATLTARAVGRWRGRALPLPANAVTVVGDGVEVRLPAVVERAFLVRAERALLQAIGPLEIRLAHPALAAVLTPASGPLRLSPDDGDLAKVSAVYRSLLWREGADAPFEVDVRCRAGAGRRPHDGSPPQTIAYRADPGDELLVELSTLRVASAAPHPIVVEAAQDRPGGRVSLGRRPVGVGALAVWAYHPSQGGLVVRVRVSTDATDNTDNAQPAGGYWTAWHEVAPTGVVLAPRTRRRSLPVLLVSSAARSHRVEVVPTSGRGGRTATVVDPGRSATVTLVEDEERPGYRYRFRAEGATDWSTWITGTGNVITLDPATPHSATPPTATRPTAKRR